MIDLIRFAAELQDFFHRQGWNFCFIGGIALQAWGEPRLTRDIDVSLFTGFGSEEAFISELTRRYPSRIPDATQFALANRVLLLSSDRGIPFDVALAAFPFEERIIVDACLVEFLEQVSLRVCTATDLVLLKAFASRPKDWMDIEGIITRQGTRLDRKALHENLQPLCELKGDPDILRRLDEAFQRFG